MQPARFESGKFVETNYGSILSKLHPALHGMFLVKSGINNTLRRVVFFIFYGENITLYNVEKIMIS